MATGTATLIAKSRSSSVSGLMHEISSSSATAAPVASICAPRSTSPSGRSSTTPAWMWSPSQACAVVERDTCGGMIA